MNDKRQVFKLKFIIEGILALFICLTPILFYSYKYFLNEQSIAILGIRISSNGFENVGTALYYYIIKIIPLILLIIWFATSKRWWYHAILIPISMYSFQLYTVLASDDTTKIDENEILYVVAVTMVIIPIVYFIRIKLVDKYVHGIDLKAMDTELQILKAKEELRKEREKLEQRKETLSKKM
jgi:hypothetical protein